MIKVVFMDIDDTIYDGDTLISYVFFTKQFSFLLRFW